MERRALEDGDLGWLAFVASRSCSAGVGVVNLTDSEPATGETARAEAILSTAGFNDLPVRACSSSRRR